MDDVERGQQGPTAHIDNRLKMTKGPVPEEPTQGLAGRNEDVDSNETMAHAFDAAVENAETIDSGVYNSPTSAPAEANTLPRPALPPDEE